MGKYFDKLSPIQAHISGSKYLNKDLLSEGGQYLLLKGATGYGGTTAALNDSTFCNIVATPNTSHVINKQKSIGSNGGAAGFRIFYIYGGSLDSWSGVLNYLKKGGAFHVYTTFSNLHKALTNYSTSLTQSNVRVIIDEYQQLYSMASYAEVHEDLSQRIQGFKNLILTSATFHKYGHHRGISHLKTKLAYSVLHDEKRDVEYISNAKPANVTARIRKNVEEGISTYVFTNEIKIFRDQINADTLTGNTLALKIAFYSDTKQTKEIDTSKKVHIISSSGYEGIDIFESDCEVLIYGKYSKHKHSDHLRVGENDLYQITGRFRNGYTSAKFYEDKLEGYDAFIDAENAKVLEREQGLAALKAAGGPAYYMALPTLEQSAKYDKTLDVYDLIRGHKFSPRFRFKKSTAIKVGRQRLINIQPSKLLQRANLADAKAIAENPSNFLAYKVLDQEDKAKRKGYHSGLNIDDILIYLIRDFIGDSDHLIRAARRYDVKKHRDDRARMVKAVYDVLSFFVLSDEFGAYFEKELSERNFNLDYLSKKSKYFNGFQLALIQHLNTTLWALWGIDINKHPKLPKVCTKPTEAQTVRLKSMSQKLFNFIWLYNTRATKGSAFRQDLDAAIAQYIGSDKYKEKHPEGDITASDLVRSHREYLLDVFLSFSNLDETFTIKKDGREYSRITAHPSPLRLVTPSRLKEIDFRQLNPRIAAMWLDSKGHPELLNKVQLGDIYNLQGLSRNKAKVKINTALNLHQAHERREKNYIELGMSAPAAKLWASAFEAKGSFFRFAATIEKKLVEKVADYYRDYNAEGFRLHDAYITQEKTISVPPLSEVVITFEGKRYAYPLGSTDWN